MERTRQQLTPVHVLRHSFRPNEPLVEIFEQIVPGSTEQSTVPPVVKSLSMIALNRVNYANQKFARQITEARRGIETGPHQSIPISEDFKVLRIGEKAVAVLLAAENKIQILKLQHDTNEIFTDKNLLHDPGYPNFHFYVRLDSPVPFREGQLADMADHLAHYYADPRHGGLLALQPDSLVGFEQYRDLSR